MKFKYRVHTAFIMKWHWISAFVGCVVAGLPEVFYNEAAFQLFKANETNEELFAETNGSLFGFSVSSVYSGPRSELVIGAPLHKEIGDVYTCKLGDTDSTCTAVNKTIIDLSNKVAYTYDSYSFWFGATVKGNDKFFVGCAPRFIGKHQVYHLFLTYGQCYTYEGDNQNELVYLDETRRRLNTKTTFVNSIDSFGWSLDIIDSKNSIVAGSPVLTTGMIYKRDLSNLNYNIKQEEKNRTNRYFYYNNSTEMFNFGYSVASLLSKSKKLHIAVGSTFKYGSVTYLKEPENSGPDRYALRDDNNTKIFETKLILSNFDTLRQSKTGSMFGATLCPAMLSTQALLVGAPASSNNDDYNVGSVYVYISSYTTDIPDTLVKTVIGETLQSFFGSAIVSLGDLNGDLQDEIAISAPYETDGQGAVYIYSGAELTKPGDTMYARDCQQKIGPSATYKAFGFSLSALRDYDDNGCNELAIGIPESSAVMVLRCAAAITIHLKPFPYSLSKASNITLEVCFTVDFPDKPSTIQAVIDVQINIQHDDATIQNGVTHGKESNLTIPIQKDIKNNLHCGRIIMDLKDNGKYHKNIFYEMSATLSKDPMRDRDFKASHIKLNETSETKLTGSIWIQECGETVCTPELNMTSTFSEEYLFKIGSSDTLDVFVSINNTGDVAYETCVRVLVTGVTPLPADECKIIASKDGLPLGVQCRPKQLLRGFWNTTVAVDTTALSNLDETISINVTLYELCGNSSTIKDTKMATFQLYPDAESVEILGRTDELNNVVGIKKADIKLRKSFEHIYMISNTGVTNWKDVSISILLDKQDFVTSAVMIESAKCQLTNDNSTSENYTCYVPTLPKQSGIGVTAIMKVVPDKLSGRIGKENLTIYSEIHVYLGGSTHKSCNITSELRLVEATVPIWIIIAACILALIIFSIIVFILRECGCLRRKNKEDLEKAIINVRRQTIIRRSKTNHSSSIDQDTLSQLEQSICVGSVMAELTSAIASQAQKNKDRRLVVKDVD